MTDTLTLDDKDLTILRLLQKDGKLSVRDIAAQIHLSATPTHERIKRLEQSGIIRQYAALLDPKLAGKSIMVFCHVSLKEHDKKMAKSFIQAVSRFDEVVGVYNIAGEFDFLLKILSSSMETYHQFYVNKLSEVRGIGQTKSSFVMDVVKETHHVL